jgi:hypothetical protein
MSDAIFLYMLDGKPHALCSVAGISNEKHQVRPQRCPLHYFIITATQQSNHPPTLPLPPTLPFSRTAGAASLVSSLFPAACMLLFATCTAFALSFASVAHACNRCSRRICCCRCAANTARVCCKSVYSQCTLLSLQFKRHWHRNCLFLFYLSVCTQLTCDLFESHAVINCGGAG